MALEHTLHLSESTQGDPISVAQDGGNILVHSMPSPKWTDRVTLHIANLAGASASTVTILVNEIVALSIVMAAGSVYDYEAAVSGRTIHVSAASGNTALKVTGVIHRGGLARKYN